MVNPTVRVKYREYQIFYILFYCVNVKELGEYLYSGTLTPLLKKLESKGLLTRKRSDKDERNLIVELTTEGEKLKEKAVDIPLQMAECTKLTAEEGILLYNILYKILGKPLSEEK